jgi:Tfp pilus assembly protein PilF
MASSFKHTAGRRGLIAALGCLLVTAGTVHAQPGRFSPTRERRADSRSRPSAEARAKLEACHELFKTGQYAECLESARVAPEDRDLGPEWRMLMIRSMLELGQYDQAALEITAALSEYPLSLQLSALAHTVYQHNGQPNRAEEMLMRTYRIASRWRLDSINSTDLVALGHVLLRLGAEPRIVLEQLYNLAIETDPNGIDAYLASGDLALAKQDYELAAEQYRAALEKAGDDPDAHSGLARAFYHSDRAAMMKSLDAALFVNRQHAGALLLLAEHQIDCEAYDAAAESLDRIIAVNPHHAEAWAYRALLAELTNRPHSVEAGRAEALRFWPDNPRVDYLLGRKLSQKYRFAEGAERQRQALEFDPGYVPAKIQLAQDLLRLGNDEGWALAEQVHSDDPYNVNAYNMVTLHDNLAKFRTLRTETFIVRMAEREADVYGDRVLDLLERAKTGLCAKYGLELEGPVTLELYPNQQDFAVRTFGMPGGDGFLGVCFGNVITANSPRPERDANWEATLWHEFCHVVTLGLTRNKMPRWLSEGISVYEELQRDPAWGQQMNPQYRQMILDGELTPISELSGAFLAPPSPMHLQFAYYESMLVVDFLVERYGLESLRAILADLATGQEINSTISKHAAPMEKLEEQFEAFARKRAENLAPKVDWERPEQLALVTSETAEQWLAEHPNSYWALSAKASGLLTQQQWEQAKEPLKRLISLYPQHVGEGNAYELLALAHRRLGETEEEHKVLGDLAERSATSKDAYARLMEIEAERRQWDRVAEYAEKYLAVYPLLGAVHRQLAQASEELGRDERAIASYRRLLLLEPADPVDAHYRLARLLRQRDPAAAKRHVLEALADAPRFRRGHELLLELRADEDEETSASSGEVDTVSKAQEVGP